MRNSPILDSDQQVSKSLLRSIVARMPCVLWTTDDRLRYTSSMGAGLANVGLRDGEVVGASLLNYHAPENGNEAALVEAHVRALNGQNVSCSTVYAGRKFRCFLQPLRGETTIVGCIGLAFDLTAMREASVEDETELTSIVASDWVDGDHLTELARSLGGENPVTHAETTNALHVSEELFRNAFENTNVAMVLTDLNHRFVRANEAFARMFGYTNREVLELTMLDITHPDDIAQSIARREALNRGEISHFQIEKRYVHKSGRILWGLANVSLVRDSKGEPSQYVGQVQDVTDRKLAEEACRESEIRYRTLVETSIQGVVVQQDGLICYANPACLRMFGYEDAAELIGRSWETLVCEDELPLLRQRAAASVRGESVGLHPGWKGLRRDGNHIWVESAANRIIWEDRPAVLSLLIDVTEGKRMQEQFRQSQKMEAIGRLAGGIAHDFNNLLTIINGYSELVLSALPSSGPVNDMILEIRRAGDRAASLTRQLLAFSRKQILAPRLLDVNELIRAIEMMLRRLIGADIDINLALAKSLNPVKVDPGQLEQAIMNLVVNARDAMPDGGRLTIETMNVTLNDAYFRKHPYIQARKTVMIAVSDTGTGMDDEVKAKLFEPFFTTKDAGKGTGLGLAMVYGMVKQSGGHVEVYSEVGRGSALKIYLPQSNETKDGSPKTDSIELVVPTGSETILLAEDQADVRSLAAMALRSYGYNVLEAKNGLDAASLCAADVGSIHLLLTDVVMPHISGRELATTLLQTRPTMKVLFMSGYTDDAVIRHGVLETGANFLQKPFTPTLLARKVREVLDAR